MKHIICGMDEAGRGPLAGPVCAASVILGEGFFRSRAAEAAALNDSKKLSAARRKKLGLAVKEYAFAWGIGWASHEEIDSINILRASLLAMKRSFFELAGKLPCAQKEDLKAKVLVIADGLYVPLIGEDESSALIVSCKALVKADAQISEVMAASILAKTARDSYMEEMALAYPQYGYERHKGYGTKAHMEAIKKYGPSPIQRLTFKIKS